MRTSSRMHSMRSGSVTKYGERYPRSNCMPSTTSRVVSIVLDSSTVMTPSLPTFFMASAMMPPICLSLLAEMVPTWAVTPSLVMIGAPNFFSITALRPLGPRVIFTASARAFTPRKIAWREFSPVTICFAILFIPPDILFAKSDENCTGRKTGHYSRPKARLYNARIELLPGRFRRAAQLRQNFFFAKDEIFLVLDLDFRTAVFAEEDTIAGLDVQRDQFALLALASADGDDFAFHRLFFCGVRDDD